MLDLFSLQIDKTKLHDKYKVIKDNLQFTGEQEVLKDWIEGFVDRDKKIIKEFQENFHSSFWEFYLFAVFKEAGFNVDFTKNRPDFIIDKPQKLYVEAVVANIKKDGKKEEERTMDDILSMLEPVHLQKNFDESLKESITRYSNAIISKSEKYTGYYKKNKYYKGYSEDICSIVADIVKNSVHVGDVFGALIDDAFFFLRLCVEKRSDGLKLC